LTRKAKFPAYVFGDESGRDDLFVATGFMGDPSAITKMAATYSFAAPAPSGEVGQHSLILTYKPRGPKGWAGLYWLTPANNWGKIKGAGFDLRKADQLTFWIRGEKGGEKISEVKIGGITGPYPDSDVLSYGPLKLTRQWNQYSIPLEGKDLRHIVGGFAIIFRRADNPFGATVYLDEIVFHNSEEEKLRREKPAQITSAPEQTQEEPAKKVVVLSPVSKLEEPFSKEIRFSSGKSVFSLADKATLDEIVALAKKYGNVPIVVAGHTDGTGGANVNLKISKIRAQKVSDYMIEQGIPSYRIVAIGYGESRPVATNKTPEGRNKNRRVEVLLKPRGMK